MKLWAKRKLKRKELGFTIVELLIVIVVIAILAAISIVAYNGIQSRANDTVVQSDLRNFANIISQMHAVNGVYPLGGSATGDSTKLPGVKFTPSKKSYDQAVNNFFYCEGQKSGAQGFAIGARSQSGAEFLYESTAGSVKKVSSFNPLCMNGWDASTSSHTYGFYKASGSWWPWAS